ncbi:MAG: winged helix-turn-helix domain-containing protein [Arenicella sp.]|nr:winged helix-turn-helix domain-containing protein [Arenicella sp.]
MKYRVNAFEIDCTRFSIHHIGEKVSCEPKVFDLIVFLIENCQRVVSRDELFDNVWAGREVSDATLSNHIKNARRVLGDNGDLQHTVKTIRGRGYQFVADVCEVSALPTEHTNIQGNNGRRDQKTGSVETTYQRFLRDGMRTFPSLKWAVLVSFAILSIVVFLHLNGRFGLGVAAPTPYVLVVPFEVSGDPSDQWRAFSDQVSREVILKLRRISGLRVVPVTSAFLFRENSTHANIREKLPDVHYVLNGVINVSSGDMFRVSLELEDLTSGELVWNGDYRQRANTIDQFTLRAEIAASVSESLKVAILDEERRALGDLPTTNLAAYELYVAGQREMSLLTHESLLKSVDLFEQAIGLDPNLEVAHLAKADSFRIIMAYFQRPIDVLPKVIESVASALKLNQDSARARSSLGLAYVLAWRWEDAWEMLRQAQKLDPSLVETQIGFALYYSGIGNVAGVYRALNKANELDPLNIELADWGHWALVMVGEVEGALRWGEDKLQLHPGVGMIYSGASVSASLAGDHAGAVVLAQKGVDLDSGSPYSLLALAQAYGHLGASDKAEPLIVKAMQEEGYLCPYELAISNLLMGDIDDAFLNFNRAVAARSNCLIFTRNDPRLAAIRHDLRYKALLTRVGLNDESILKMKAQGRFY